MSLSRYGTRAVKLLLLCNVIVLAAVIIVTRGAKGSLPLQVLALVNGAALAAVFLQRKNLRAFHTTLRQGMDRAARGGLDVFIAKTADRRKDILINAFNHMTRQIKQLLKIREELIRDVTHEMNAPVSRMKLSLTQLAETKTKQDLIRDVTEIEIMISEILGAERIVRSAGSAFSARIDLTAMADMITAAYRLRPPGIRKDAWQKGLYVQGDEAQLRMLLRNVLENSCKYSSKDSGPVTVSLVRRSKEAFLSIKDDGPGIPEEDLPFIFDPYFRSGRSREVSVPGFGLGLSISRRIAELHGGGLTLCNAAGGGATAEIRLPLAAD